jgi:hypothetical protein
VFPFSGENEEKAARAPTGSEGTQKEEVISFHAHPSRLSDNIRIEIRTIRAYIIVSNNISSSLILISSKC